MIRLLKRILSTGHKNYRRQGQIKEELPTEQVYIHALMDNITDNIYFKDINSRFLRANKSMTRYFNLSDPTEVIGKTDFDFFTEEHAQKAFEDEQMIIKTGQPIKREEKETWENRPDSWVSTVKMPLRNGKGKIIGTFGISRDITDLKLAELMLKEQKDEIERQNEEYLQLNEELQALNMELSEAKERAEKSDRLKSAFLHNMSHEIRTPLHAIMGFSDLISSQFDNEAKLKEYNKTIIQRCSDLLNIIDDILDISKIESGQLSVHLEEIDLKALFEDLFVFFEAYRERIKKQHIELSFQLDIDLSGVIVLCDKTKLKQVLSNLVENAFKFTSSGEIIVGCSSIKKEELDFFVSDTGIGIPTDKQAFVFERFAQVEEGYSRIYGGTGLGLSIVKGMVELLGGKIWLESRPGKGSVFYFTVPCNPQKNMPDNTN
jgi:PAS domain S-box-containing protein